MSTSAPGRPGDRPLRRGDGPARPRRAPRASAQRPRDVARRGRDRSQRSPISASRSAAADRRDDRLRPDRRPDRPRRPVPRRSPDGPRGHRSSACLAGRASRSSTIRSDMPNQRGGPAARQPAGPQARRPARPGGAAGSTRSARSCRCSKAGSPRRRSLDPLAQDARRLMGKHLPELIERYERVPAAYRRERDGEGLTVDERLVQGLDAAKTALDDLGRKLAREDLDAFETQGRFIESRYKDDDGAIQSELSMAFELERVLYETEDFLRRSLGSRDARATPRSASCAAQARGRRCGARSARASLLAGLLAACSPGASFVGEIGFFDLAGRRSRPPSSSRFVSLFWPTRAAGRAERDRGGERRRRCRSASSPSRAEEGLLDRCDELPGRALPAADAIMARLPSSSRISASSTPASPLAGDARRLIGQHLPRLVDSYLELPASSPRARLREQPPLHRKPRHRRRRARQPARDLLPRPPGQLRHPAAASSRRATRTRAG